MSLINTTGSTSRVIDEMLTVTYSHMIVRGSWSWTSANVSGSYDKMQEVHRYARETVKYVGLTKSAAEAQRDLLIEKYKRSFKISDWNSTVMNGQWDTRAGGERVMADISMRHVAGDMWEVTCSTNEDDMRMLLVASAVNYDTLFSDENARVYASTEA